MTMLAILLSYMLERFLNSIDHYRTYKWFSNFGNWSRQRFEHKAYWYDTVGMLIILFIPVFVIAFIHNTLSDVNIVFDFLFSIAIILYCFGPKDTHEAARLFIEASQHDNQQRAQELAAEILDNNVPDDDSQLYAEIGHNVLLATNERVLGVFLWFVVLGPMGAILYRLSSIFLRDIKANGNNENMEHSARLLFAILNWAPSHLTALCYGIIGSFIDAFHEWKKYKSFDPFNPCECDKMLVMTGLGSLRMDADSVRFDETSLKHILDMSSRTIMVWLTALALLTMAGWAS